MMRSCACSSKSESVCDFAFLDFFAFFSSAFGASYGLKSLDMQRVSPLYTVRQSALRSSLLREDLLDLALPFLAEPGVDHLDIGRIAAEPGREILATASLRGQPVLLAIEKNRL